MKYQPGYLCHAPAQYVKGIRPSDGVREAEDLSSGEVEAACIEHPEWTSKSEKVKRCLAFIATFAP